MRCFLAVAGLRCYECYSTKKPDCGEYFYPHSFEPTDCKPEETTCALQRQEAIPGEQVQAIVRGCYKPGQLEGLNSSEGCRSWMNPNDKYAARYCFCESDLCNAAQSTSPWIPAMPLLVAVVITLTLLGNVVERIPQGNTKL